MRTSSGLIDSLRKYSDEHPLALDCALLAIVTSVAAALRLSKLGDIPYGVHSDEAQLGTDAHKILHGDFIGVYTHAVLGQPSGHAYLTLPSIWLLGDTAFALRLPLALVGIAAIPLLYLLVRVSFARIEAFFASALLAISYWHLFYSRVAHWSVSYGTIVLAVLLCYMLGLKTQRRAWYAAGGALLGIGAYTYNIYPVAVLAVVVSIVVISWLRRRNVPWRRYRVSLALMAMVALVVALPMIVYVARPSSYYWFHVNNYSEVDVTKSPEYQQADTAGKARLIGEQARTFAGAYAWDAPLDSVDGNGSLRPMFDPATLILLGAGLVMAVRRRREPMVVAALCCLIIIPLPAVLQRGSIMREPLGAAPFAMFLAALPLAALWRLGLRVGRPSGAVAASAAFFGLALISAVTVRDYFWTFRKDPWPRTIYFSQMTTASEYMRDLPGDTQIFFYSNHASINLETRQFLAPDVHGTDRSREFSSVDGSIDVADRTRPAAFVLLDAYLPLLTKLEGQYPDGQERIVERDGKTEFYAYELPPLPAGVELQ